MKSYGIRDSVLDSIDKLIQDTRDFMIEMKVKSTAIVLKAIPLERKLSLEQDI